MLCLFTLIFLHSVFAAEFDHQGSLRLNAGQIIQPETTDATHQTLSIEPEFRSTYLFKDQFQFEVDAWANYDQMNKAEKDVFQFELNEMTIGFQNSQRRLKFGSSIRSWEGTDLINPMDVMGGKNFVDPLNSRNRSGVGVFYDESRGNFEWDFSYIFKQNAHRLPGNESPWWPRSFYLPTESDSITLLLSDDLRYEILDPEIINSALDQNMALRVQYHAGNADFAVAAVEGLATPPLLIPIIDVSPIEVSPRTIYQLQSPVRILPLLYRQRSVAANVTWTLGEVILRASVNHTQPLGNDRRIPSWSQLGVLGIEKTFYINNQMLTVLGQFIDSRRPDVPGLSILTSLFQKSYMAGLRWAPRDNWTYFAAYFQETTTWSSFTRLEIQWAFIESMSLSVEGNIFEGPKSSAIGTFDRNDSAYLHLKKSF